MDPSTALSEELNRMVHEEAAATRRLFDEHWSLPVAERVARSRCIDDLEYEATSSIRHLCFRCLSGNHSDFREGDFVRLNRGDPKQSFYNGTLYRVDDDRVWIEPDRQTKESLSQFESGSWVLDRSYLDLESFYRKAVDELGSTVRGRERILPLLSGEVRPEVDLELLTESESALEHEGVNESQSEAIAQAVATDLCHLIQGPPGTGKTFVLAHVVKQRLARGERILVTAATHRAIHNALNMIRRILGGSDQVVKVGPDIYDPELEVPQFQTFAETGFAQRDCGYVIGATPFAARSKRLRGVEFDAVVLDEAGQMTLPLAIMAMLSADTYIFVGDHRQLPPVVHSLPASEAHLASAFGRLNRGGFLTTLDITYRLNRELVTWPAEMFYGGKLRPANRNAARRLPLPQPPQRFVDILTPDEPQVFVRLEHTGSTRSSVEEATLVANLIEELARCGFDLGEIAVVVPFRRQARLTRTFLRAKPIFEHQDLSELVVDTVERMQGQERELVIVSMTASKPEYLESVLTFVLQPQRLNVSVTRARSKVIIIASEQVARTDCVCPDQLESVALWKSLLSAGRTVSL